MKTIKHKLGCEIISENNEAITDCHPTLIKNALKESGYVLFKGFNPSQEDFETLTTACGTCAPTRHVHYPTTGEALGFHAEDAYNPYRPDAIWFFCAFKGSDGGAPTGVVDGVQVFNQLPKAFQEFCCQHQLRFNRQWKADLWEAAVNQYGVDEISSSFNQISGIEHQFLSDGFLYIGYEAPIVIQSLNGEKCFSNTLLQAISDPEFYGMSLSTGEPIPEELLEVAGALTLKNEKNIEWETGEIAVIDNTRMMHRRPRYTQVDRDLRVRHCEDLFGTQLPDASSSPRQWVKNFIQGDLALPSRVGLPNESFSHSVVNA